MELLTERQDGSDVTGGGSAELWWSTVTVQGVRAARKGALGNGEMGGWGPVRDICYLWCHQDVTYSLFLQCGNSALKLQKNSNIFTCGAFTRK